MASAACLLLEVAALNRESEAGFARDPLRFDKGLGFRGLGCRGLEGFGVSGLAWLDLSPVAKGELCSCASGIGNVCFFCGVFAHVHSNPH